MEKIIFGTDGWRAIIAKEFTTDNVARISFGAAFWLNKQNLPKKVVIGYDCRFGGQLFAETAAKCFTDEGIEVILSKNIVGTPTISFATKHYNCGLGVIITASHNPYDYNGYKLKGHYGGPLLPKEISEVEAYIPMVNTLDINSVSIETLEKSGILQVVDIDQPYLETIRNNFDLPRLNKLGKKVSLDAMYGTGQFVFNKLMPDAQIFRGIRNPLFPGISPEPIPRNLEEYGKFILENKQIEIPLAVDGDADRIAMMKLNGEFLDTHHVMLLLVYYLAKYKGMKGKVATGFSTTVKLKALCDYFGFELEVVPIGFKFICKLMLTEDILMGGEESGGIAVKGHIPERDGIWNGLTLVEAVANTGKSIDELIEEIYEITGSFAFHRIDLKLENTLKNIIVSNCQNNLYQAFGDYKVLRVDTLDGFKFIIDENTWVMIRPSGTEPVLRTYAEAENMEMVLDILKQTHKTILEN